MWQPDAEPLRKLRREIDRKPHKIKQILTAERLRTEFLGRAPNDEKKVIKAFIGLTANASTALKRHPKVSTSFFGSRTFPWRYSKFVLRPRHCDSDER